MFEKGLRDASSIDPSLEMGLLMRDFGTHNFAAEVRQVTEAKPPFVGFRIAHVDYPGGSSERFDGQIEGRLC